MAAAADIQQAIDEIVTNLDSPGTTVIQKINAWASNMFTPEGFAALAVGSATFWKKGNVDERTVFNWAVPTLRDQRIINQSGNSVLTQNIMINIVLRALLAVQAATAANRITQDQEDTVVAVYNASF
jgi:hypothetical protein